MNTPAKILAGVAALVALGALPTGAGAACPALLDYSHPALNDSKKVSLCAYQGKVLLIVNTASQCGYTPQYEGLQKLYSRLKDKGLVVLGFPADDFGGQEPGGNSEIADFCRINYGVDFPMFAKTSVKGRGANPLYQRLAAKSGVAPAWNFHKYLVNRDATQVVSFNSATTPEDPALLRKIDEFLK